MPTATNIWREVFEPLLAICECVDGENKWTLNQIEHELDSSVVNLNQLFGAKIPRESVVVKCKAKFFLDEAHPNQQGKLRLDIDMQPPCAITRARN